jgi:hypothetical protein
MKNLTRFHLPGLFYITARPSKEDNRAKEDEVSVDRTRVDGNPPEADPGSTGAEFGVGIETAKPGEKPEEKGVAGKKEEEGGGKPPEETKSGEQEPGKETKPADDEQIIVDDEKLSALLTPEGLTALGELAGKKNLKSLTDMVKIYEDGERRSTRSEQIAATMRKGLEGMGIKFDNKGNVTSVPQAGAQLAGQPPVTGTGQPVVAPRAEGESIRELFLDAMEEDPWAAQLALIHSVLNEKMAPYKQTWDDQRLEAIVDQVAVNLSAEKDFVKMEAEIAGELDKMTPQFKKAAPEEAVETAYYRALKAQGAPLAGGTPPTGGDLELTPPNVIEPGGTGPKTPQTEGQLIKKKLREGVGGGVVFFQ